jgi:hypothetical protein
MRTSSRGDLTIALDAILKEMTEEIERIDRDAANGSGDAQKADYLGGCMGPSTDDGLGGCMG